jgi:hypothetical protein
MYWLFALYFSWYEIYIYMNFDLVINISRDQSSTHPEFTVCRLKGLVRLGNLPFGWVLSAMWLCKSGHFHSCCPSPVLNILLEISWKILYIASYVCIIDLILHIFKMSYQLRNIEQCYLPWPNVICLGKWQITCTATKTRSFHVHPTSRPCFCTLPPITG